jgi:hypothetical protein
MAVGVHQAGKDRPIDMIDVGVRLGLGGKVLGRTDEANAIPLNPDGGIFDRSLPGIFKIFGEE